MLVESIGRIGGPALTFDKRVLDYLIFIARKHEVVPSEFLESIVRAWLKDTSRCGKLKIQCIIKTEDHPYFRITCQQHLVTQTRVNLKLLTNIAKISHLKFKKKTVS